MRDQCVTCQRRPHSGRRWLAVLSCIVAAAGTAGACTSDDDVSPDSPIEVEGSFRLGSSEQWRLASAVQRSASDVQSGPQVWTSYYGMSGDDPYGSGDLAITIAPGLGPFGAADDDVQTSKGPARVLRPERNEMVEGALGITWTTALSSDQDAAIVVASHSMELAKLIGVADSIDVRSPSDNEPAGCLRCVSLDAADLEWLTTAYSAAFEFDFATSDTSLAWYDSTADPTAHVVLVSNQNEFAAHEAVVRWYDPAAAPINVAGHEAWAGSVAALPSQPPLLPVVVWSPGSNTVVALTAVTPDIDIDGALRLAATVTQDAP